MKKNEIEDVVKRHFKTAGKLFHKIIIDYNINDIIEFKTEIKKLRSFLHLLDIEFPSGIQIMLSTKMKTFYGYAGIIRNLQYHVKHITAFCETYDANVPHLYLAKLDKEIRSWEINMLDFIDVDNNFLSDEEKMLAELPEKLTTESIKKFIDYNFSELRFLLAHPGEDENLQHIRKFSQDIFYNWSYINNYITPLPQSLATDEGRKTILNALEAFRDKCIDITLLQTYCIESWNNEEKKLLNTIKKVWEEDKIRLRKSAFDNLKLMQLASVKEIR